MENRFLKKTLIYFIGNLSSKLLTALLIPIYAFFVSPTELGNYDYITALMNILIPLCFFNMWDSILKYALNVKDKRKLKEIYTTSCFFISALGIVFIFIYSGFYYFKLIDYPYFLLSLLMMFSYGLVTFWQYSCRAFQKNKLYALSGVVSSFINVGLIMVLVVWLKLGLLGLILSYTIAMLSAVLFMEYVISLRKYIHYHSFNLNVLKKMLRFSAPIVLNTVSLWGMSGISKIICVNYLDVSANGLFSFAGKFGTLITVVGSILGAAIIEEAYLEKNLESYCTRFSKLIQRIFDSYLILVCLAIPLLNILYDLLWMDTAYYESKILLFSILLGAIFSSVATNFGSAFQVTEKTNYVFITSMIGAIASISLSFSMINSLGVLAVAVGQMLGSLVLLLSRAFFAYKLTGLKIDWKKSILLIILFYSIFKLTYTTTILIKILIELLIIVTILILYKRKISYFIEKLKKNEIDK